MKIGINAFGCNHGRSGIGAYIHSLIHNVPKELPHTVQIFGPQFDKYIYTTGLDPSLYEGITVEDNELAERLFVKTNLNSLVSKLGYDALLFPAGLQMLPMNFSKPSFLVMQEIIKQENSFNIFASLDKLNKKKLLNKVSGIIAASNYIKDNLIAVGVNRQKIKVIYNGIDTSVFHPKDSEHALQAVAVPFEIQKPYIIYASSISEPEKRHSELLKAFEIFKAKTGLPHRLVIAGQDGKIAPVFHREVLSSRFVSDIILAGYIEQNQLAHFYRESDLCVFPSEIEGVGLPLIEAMACGIPTACARATVLPEIAGDASCYFDAKNPADIAEVIERLASTAEGSTAAFRTELVTKGLEWVKRFSWEKTATKTFEYISDKITE